MSSAKGRTLIGKELDPVTWDGDVYEGTPEAEDLNLQILEGLFQQRKQALYPSKGYIPT